MSDARSSRVRAALERACSVRRRDFPFAYDADCGLRPDPASWPYGLDWDERTGHFSSESRRRRYPLYLEQLACTQRRVGESAVTRRR